MIKIKTGHTPPLKNDAPIAVPEAGDLISRAMIIAIVTERVRQPYDLLRNARGNVRKRIEYAIKKGKLQPPVKGQFVFGEVIRWARQQKGWGEP